jgi:hypothetical protein
VRTEPNFTRDGRTPTVYIPISIRRRGGSKLVLAPDGTNDTWAAPCRRIDKAMLKNDCPGVPAAGYVETSTYATIAESANAEKIMRPTLAPCCG